MENETDFGCTIVSHKYRYIGINFLIKFYFLPIFAVSLSPNSPAGRCGQLRVGDCVVAINGMSADMMSHQVSDENFFDFNLYFLQSKCNKKSVLLVHL